MLLPGSIPMNEQETAALSSVRLKHDVLSVTRKDPGNKGVLVVSTAAGGTWEIYANGEGVMVDG
jgi:hypothetical protein